MFNNNNLNVNLTSTRQSTNCSFVDVETQLITQNDWGSFNCLVCQSRIRPHLLAIVQFLTFFSYWLRKQNIVFRSVTALAKDNEHITHDQRKQAATVFSWMYNWSFAALCVINPLDSYYSLHNGIHLSWETWR